MFVENPNRTNQLVDELTAIWEASVKATHTFLNEIDIIFLKPFVEMGIRKIDNLIVTYDDGNPTGFMGISQQKVEMLFLSPDSIGKGIGKKLITKAIHKYSAVYVDVNEQNPHAVDFYNRAGFEVFEQIEFDGQGNPFPILKMKLR